MNRICSIAKREGHEDIDPTIETRNAVARAVRVLVGAVLAVGCTEAVGPPPAEDPVPDRAPVASVVLEAGSRLVAVAGQRQLDITVRDASGNALEGRGVTWASGNPAVVTVDASGVVSGIDEGSALVTATTEGVSGSIAIEVQGFLIGSSGGVATSADGRASVTVPEDALVDPVVITIEPARVADLPTRSDEVFVQRSAYEFGPAGQQFAVPAMLTIRYDPARIPSAIEESSLGLGRASGAFWTRVDGGSVDMGAAEVRGEVTGFSTYSAVGEPDEVANEAPAASITGPADMSTFASLASVTFDGTGTDPEDGALSGASLVWTSDLDGQFGTGLSVTTSSLSIGVHTITLTVTDSHGATHADQITVTITNNPPTASITGPADMSTFASLASVTFDGTGTDPEDGALSGASLVWTSNLDGQFGTGLSVTTSSLSIGVHTITLTVTDSHGATHADQITVTITNNPPTASITGPADMSTFASLASVTFDGTGTDPEDGALSGASLVWTSDLDGQFGTGLSVTTSSLSIGVHTITLTVTDSHGATHADQITVTITNNPPTASITGPADMSTFASLASVTFDGTGTDPEDGALSGASLVWTSNLDGQFGTGLSVTTSSLSIGVHTITLTVTDSHGATHADQITVTIV